MFKAQAIGTKFLLVLLGAIIVMAVIAPYIHIFLDRKDTVEVFGFRNLRNFLYAIGLPISLFFCASLLFYTTKYIKEDSPKLYLKIVSSLFLWSSFFQFIWIFWDRQDLDKSFYYFSMIMLSAIICTGFISLANTITKINRIKTRKEKLNNYYNKIYLSKREKEIAEMLHSGINDYNFISNSLVISYKTVTSHTSNIFKKANVTSKQEFIDLRGKLIR